MGGWAATLATTRQATVDSPPNGDFVNLRTSRLADGLTVGIRCRETKRKYPIR